MATAHPLAYCPTCKIAFPVAPRTEGGTLVFQNSTTNCPNGHFARILKPHYQTFQSEIQTTLEHLRPAARRAARAIWDRLCRREVTAEQAQAEAEKVTPGLRSVFNAENIDDPVRKAILAALLGALVTTSDHSEEPSTAQQDVTSNAPVPAVAEAHQAMQEKRKGGNRAFQRSLRHKQRMLMNPRSR
jgi:hypothetical protein